MLSAIWASETLTRFRYYNEAMPSPGRSLLKLLDQSALPVYALDARRRIVYANEALGKWLGREPDSLAGIRCDYHAGIAEAASSEIGAALCPPPEAFDGTQREGQIARPPGDLLPPEQRPARFGRLPLEAGEALLLVIVEPVPAEADDAKPLPAAITPSELHAQLQRLRGELGRRYAIGQLVGTSDAIRSVREQVRIAAAAQTRVLIVGPAGSGREHVARTIHYAQRSTSIGPLTPIACSLVDAEAMQSTLTSLLRRQAETPTERPPAALLVDVDRLRPDAQQELAGFLLLPDIELHTLATSRISLQRLAAKGRFRTDLAYALSTLTIVLPPLRERQEDVPLLAQHFLEETNAAGGKQLSGFATKAMELLIAHDWPGNFDELARTVREAAGRATGPLVQAADLPDALHLALHAAAHPPREMESIRLDEYLAEIEKELLQRALRVARGNKSKAAELLGINRQRLLRRLSQLGLTPPQAEEEPVVFEPVPDDT